MGMDSLLDAMDEDGEAAHAGQPGPARSKRRDKKAEKEQNKLLNNPDSSSNSD